ncbi:helix-turn-helix domain-containing protein [Deinococcus enclensis]|uniref:Transcriptional regulator with XRE-family HTH domain n=1 Tax=Deinococcus enclensis TaxID=1049582 RepID=A0ABT9MJI7_9DEIO|nr:helix-turn-helix transcriptional regulator [Deinococcus enclensis]MDP9766631.1 transcriptional regulator with XRE-family HTH domain [Deinococcus enclensis]
MKSENLRPEQEFLVAFVKLANVRRKDKGLTQEALASLAEIDSRHLQKILAGEVEPLLSTAVRIANALDIDVAKSLDNQAKNEANFSLTSTQRTEISTMLKMVHNVEALEAARLTPEGLCNAISYAHSVIDSIDLRLVEAGVEKLGGGMVELANYSSMIGNLMAAGLAKFSNGEYKQNGPHKYPDLLPDGVNPLDGIEIKMALENNKPKGHLAKAGLYITLRYVLTNNGRYIQGKENRGDTASIWEVRLGHLLNEDFTISNTDGDSGKTAVVKAEALKRMKLVYFNRDYCPMKDYSSYL